MRPLLKIKEIHETGKLDRLASALQAPVIQSTLPEIKKTKADSDYAFRSMMSESCLL